MVVLAVWTFLAFIGFFIVGAIFLQGLRKIPADPKTFGIRTFLGKPTGKVDGPGVHFYPLYPHLSGFIPADGRKIEETVLVNVKTPAPHPVQLSVEVNIALAFDKDNPSAFLSAGGRNEVIKAISNKIRERMRKLFSSTEEGPQDWKDALAADDEMEAVILKAVMGDELEMVHGSIPTAPLLRYFSTPRQAPYKSQADRWGKGWEKLEAEFAKLSPPEKVELERRVAARHAAIREVKEGQSGLQKKSLGIRIFRLALGEIGIPKEIEEAAKKKPAAELEREAAQVRNATEAERMTHVDEQIEKFKKHLDPKSAADLVELERGNLERKISETRLSIDTDTLSGISAGLVALASIFAPKRKRAV